MWAPGGYVTVICGTAIALLFYSLAHTETTLYACSCRLWPLSLTRFCSVAAFGSSSFRKFPLHFLDGKETPLKGRRFPLASHLPLASPRSGFCLRSPPREFRKPCCLPLFRLSLFVVLSSIGFVCCIVFAECFFLADEEMILDALFCSFFSSLFHVFFWEVGFGLKCCGESSLG